MLSALGCVVSACLARVKDNGLLLQELLERIR